MTERIIVAGFGGQGVMTLGKLAASAAMRQGFEVTYLPSYGAEVRGGTANCSVVISDEPIYSPNIEEADTVIIMNQPSYGKFRARLRQDGLALVNCSMAALDDALERTARGRCLRIPATEAANELGNVRTANVIMLGAYCAAKKTISAEAVLAEMEHLAGEKTHLLEINRRAFLKGQELAANPR